MEIDKKKMWNTFKKAIKDFNMIEENDKIAVGVSGGKDSITLVHLLKELNKNRNKQFEFVAVILNPGFEKKELSALLKYLDTHKINYKYYDTNIWKVVFDDRDEKNPCSLCSKMRRGILYKKAEELGCNKLALGHHFDDIIETTLINMFYTGEFKTMLPKIKSTSGRFDLIRPLAYIKEEYIIEFEKANQIDSFKGTCRFEDLKISSKRLEIKRLLADLQKINPNIKQNIFNSARNINLDYLMVNRKS